MDAVAFYLDSQVVGDLLGPCPPSVEGEYTYMPYRGPGHHNLMTQLGTSRTPRCHFLKDGKRVEFSVVAHIEYGRLRLAGFVESLA
jgi:hypothetical protein